MADQATAASTVRLTRSAERGSPVGMAIGATESPGGFATRSSPVWSPDRVLLTAGDSSGWVRKASNATTSRKITVYTVTRERPSNVTWNPLPSGAAHIGPATTGTDAGRYNRAANS